MSTFNIIRNATVRNSMQCRHDNNVGFAVVWDQNEDFKGYDEFSGLTTRLVWDRNYFAASTSGVAYIGPSSDQTPFDGGVYDQVRVQYRVEVGFNQQVPTTGRIQFQTDDDPVYDSEKSVDFTISADNAYNEYTIDMSQIKTWQGNIVRVRLYPFIDGSPGNIVHFKSLQVESTSNFSCDTSFNAPLCSKFSEYSHPCPWVGAGGSCAGETVNDGIDILEDVNDRLLVNINGYGEHAVRITPVKGALLKDIARDIEEKLSNIGIGGYAGNKVVAEFGRLKIIADDTREASSTVVVGDSPAARTLGFFDSEGNDLSTCEGGEDAATRFEPAGTRQLSKGEIAHFYLPDPGVNNAGVSLDPRRYAVQAGRADFAEVQKESKISFVNNTIIDFNNPITNNGVITSVAFSGDADVNTKFLFFRPKSDGSLTQFASEALGPITGSLSNKVFEVSTEVRVRKGDLIGLYNGSIDVGRQEQRPNVSYFLVEGETEDGEVIAPPEIFGRGEAGLRLFAHGLDQETEAVLDIEFEQRELIEEITVYAIEEEREEEINLSRSRGGGLNGGPAITGSTGLDKFGAGAPALTDLGAVTDGVKYTEPNALALHPSWLDGTVEPPDLYDQTDFSVTLDFAKGVPVFFDIYRVIVYFRDVNNVKYFGLEYPLTTDDTDTNRNWGLIGSRYNSVVLEGKLLEPNTHPLYENPIHPTVSNYQDSYQFLEYRIIDLTFDPVQARSLRYVVDNYFFEDDETKTTLSNYILAPSPYILEIEAFARSVPVANISDNFLFESSIDGESYVQHDTVRDDGQTSARYLIGYPVRYLRAHIKPQSKLDVKSFGVSLSRSPTKIVTNRDDLFTSLDFSTNDFISAETIEVVNEDDETFNYFVNISAQRNPVERCILWNKLNSSESLSQSEIGPAPTISKRESFFPRESNYAFEAPAYMTDPFWLFNTHASAYISYDHGVTWESRGTQVTDYNNQTYLDSVSPLADTFSFVYIVVDLGDVYDLENLSYFRRSIFGRTDFTAPLYSSKDVSDPNELDLINDFVGVKEEARWIRFRAFSKESGEANIAELGYIVASLNVLSKRNKNKVLWAPAPKLTNFVFGVSTGNPCGEGWSCTSTARINYYAVDLEDSYKITNIMRGPNSGNGLAGVSDFDTVSPGQFGSLFSSSGSGNSSVAFSDSKTSDPTRVSWGSLGEAAPDRARWVILRSTAHLDEVAVYVDDNDSSQKDAFPVARWWTASLGEVYKDKSNFQDFPSSIAIDYAASQGPQVEEIEIQRSFGIDHELSKRDQLRIWFYVSDVNQLDLTQGHIALGKNTDETNGGNSPLASVEPDRENYYQWDLSDLSTLISTGWNELFLPFTDNFRVGFPQFARDDFLSLAETDVSGRNRMRWFRLQFAGVEGNNSFTINLDGFEVVRADFVPAKFGNGFYLSGDEYAKFPLNNFDTLRGSIEFNLNSDWTKALGCNTCDDPRDHTIFRFFNSDGYVLAAYMTGQGLRVYFTDGIKQYFQTDNNSSRVIQPGVNTHFAVTWDLLGQNSDWAIQIYIDNKLSSAFPVSDIVTDGFTPNPNVVLMLGGIGWDGVVIPQSDAVGGVIENIRVYNYPITDFSSSLESQNLAHIKPSDELIEISIDGNNYFNSGDRGSGLPILIRDVAPGESFKVYVRNREQEGKVLVEGQSRTGYVEIIKARSS